MDALTLIVSLAAIIVAAASAIYARKQAHVAAEARDEARRLTDIEARRDHQAVLADIELVEITTRTRHERTGEEWVAILRNRGHRTFRWHARACYSENSFSPIREGSWLPGEEIELWFGLAMVEYSHLEIWLDGDCSCRFPDGQPGHWRVTFPAPPPTNPANGVW